MDSLFGWPGGDVESALQLAGFLFGCYLTLVWVASVLWVYRDIRSRTRDFVSQLTATALALVLPILGLPLYLVLRPRRTLQDSYERQLEQEAMLSELHALSACPRCRRPVHDDFMVCAYCRTRLREPCGACGRLLLYAWRNCPYCATQRPRPTRQEEGAPPSVSGPGGREFASRSANARQRSGEETASATRSTSAARSIPSGDLTREVPDLLAPRRGRRSSAPARDSDADREGSATP